MVLDLVLEQNIMLPYDNILGIPVRIKQQDCDPTEGTIGPIPVDDLSKIKHDTDHPLDTPPAKR